MKGLDETLVFSSSGIRGVFNKSFTLHDAIKLSVAFADMLGEGEMVVGRDTRPSGSPIMNAVIAGITSVGRDVFDVGIAPTPTIAHAVRDLKAAGGLVISASHNPPEWNALKLIGPEGILLGEDWYKRLQLKVGEEHARIGSSSRFGFRRFLNPFVSYFKSIINYIDHQKLRLNPLKVVVDGGGGAGALATPKILREIGCKVRTIHCCTDGFFPRPLEPTQECLGDLSRYVVSTGSDLGFAHDCDGDRMVCVDEKGSVLRPDEGFAIIVDGVLRESPGGCVVTNISSSLLVEDVAERYHAKVIRVAVGETNVVEGMRRHEAKIGGEGSSGGVIIPAVHYVRDGPLACAKM
ncbi:MAG: phosphoglucosamine mutase, partial [Candidatus Bathyarchaeia archaeon]